MSSEYRSEVSLEFRYANLEPEERNHQVPTGYRPFASAPADAVRPPLRGIVSNAWNRDAPALLHEWYPPGYNEYMKETEMTW